MNSMCDQFFAGAAFTGNEDRHIERGNLPDLALEPAGRIAFADNLLQAERPLPKTRQLFLVLVDFCPTRRNLAAHFMTLVRTSIVWGKRLAEREAHGGRRKLKKKNT